MTDAKAAIDERRSELESLAGKDLPASDIATALLEIAEEQ